MLFGRVTMRKTKLDKKIDELIDRFTPTIREAFLTSIQGIKDQVVLQDMVDAIQNGNVLRAFEVLGFNAAAMRPITAMIEQAFETGGVTVAASAPRLPGKATFLFDVRNSRAEAFSRDMSSKLVVEITTEQQTNIAAAMAEGIKLGNNPRTTALDIVGRIDRSTGKRAGGIVGLTSQQQSYVGNMRTDLQTLNSKYFTRARRDKRFDSIVQKSFDSGKPLDDSTITKLTGRYSDSLLQLRGETIARTESMEALNGSQHEAFSQATDQGLVKQQNVKKEWDSAGDRRVRPDHQAMDGQSREMNDPFIAPDGSKLMYPGDKSMGASAKEVINCRCRARYHVDWFADLDAEP